MLAYYVPAGLAHLAARSASQAPSQAGHSRELIPDTCLQPDPKEGGPRETWTLVLCSNSCAESVRAHAYTPCHAMRAHTERERRGREVERPSKLHSAQLTRLRLRRIKATKNERGRVVRGEGGDQKNESARSSLSIAQRQCVLAYMLEGHTASSGAQVPLGSRMPGIAPSASGGSVHLLKSWSWRKRKRRGHEKSRSASSLLGASPCYAVRPKCGRHHQGTPCFRVTQDRCGVSSRRAPSRLSRHRPRNASSSVPGWLKPQPVHLLSPATARRSEK